MVHIIRALKIEPFNGRIHHAFGRIFESSRIPDALHRYQDLICLNEHTDDIHQVEMTCRRVVSEQLNDASFLRLGNVLLACNKVPAAIEAYRSAFTTVKTAECAENLAFTYQILKDQPASDLYLGYS